MTTILYLAAYLSILVFAAAVAVRFFGYLKKPMHVRWELYPVAHEGKKASYGGGYLEETEWWTKPRERSLIGELKVMIPEILLLKAVWEHNRSLWFVSYPFHLGLYVMCTFIGLILFGAVAAIVGISPDSTIVSSITALTNLTGPVGFILCIAGAIGLFYKRLTDDSLRNYASFEHFFNLALFIAAMLGALATWLTVDPSFIKTREFAANLLRFRFEPLGSPLMTAQILLAFLVIAYIPLTHMSHFFMKYFLYHDIRWGDAPNIDSPKTNEKIGVVLNYPVTWSAPHIAGHGKSTWAEVATFNPAAETEKGKE